jgi:hypothetical protein
MPIANGAFVERIEEIEVYLDLLGALERQVQSGPPVIGGSVISAQQQRILYSSVYLQLYNLVEATVTWCVNGVSEAAADGRWQPGDLAVELQREWLRSTARTHTELNSERRLESTVDMFNTLASAQPVAALKVEKGGGGNWDDSSIETIAGRLGLQLQITQEVFQGIKRKIRDDKSALVYIRDARNKLAHGGLSFGEAGDGITVSDLLDLKQRITAYLREVVAAFDAYIGGLGYVRSDRRPAVVAAP